jgi:hypothetical protein
MHARMKRVRGMRDLTTVQGLSGRTLPNSREQIVAEQSRLEHERSRLERELALWQENQQRTNERLNGVVERLALLSTALKPTDDPQPGTRREQTSSPHEEPINWHAIVLEY